MQMLQYRSTASCDFFGGQAVSVVGTPLCGDPALPRPLNFTGRVTEAQMEALVSIVHPNRLSVVALAGEGDAADALIVSLAADLSSCGSSAHILSPDGGAHFLIPSGDAAARVLVRAGTSFSASPASPAYVVSVLLTDAAVELAAGTRAYLEAAVGTAWPGNEDFNQESSGEEEE